VFFGSGSPLRGKAAVAAAWKRFFEGPAAPFSWTPDRVAVLDAGDLAMTTGPVFDPSGVRTSTFNSVWKRLADGTWKIIFDIGCPPCAAQPSPQPGQAQRQDQRVGDGASGVKGVGVEGWPTPRGHYAPAVAANGFVFVSGQLPVEQPAGRPRADLPVREQTLLALRNVEAVLQAAGTSRDRVTKVTVFVSDIAAWDEVNAAYAEFFGAHRPARSVVPSGALHFGVKVEIEVIAVAGK
jgi:2-iminobutanoate/2-iminopropanoate deaminase